MFARRRRAGLRPRSGRGNAGGMDWLHPSPDWYAALDAAALRKRIRLLNTLEQHLNAQEFDRAYGCLQELTPRSMIVTGAEQCAAVTEQLSLPVFVKGAVQSRKARGWKACVALWNAIRNIEVASEAEEEETTTDTNV